MYELMSNQTSAKLPRKGCEGRSFRSDSSFDVGITFSRPAERMIPNKHKADSRQQTADLAEHDAGDREDRRLGSSLMEGYREQSESG